MSTTDDITMTNLKSATGIADDRVSAHHPNGTGNETAMGDFVVNDVGGGDSAPTSGTFASSFLFPDKLVKKDGTVYNQPSGSYDSNDEFVFTDRVLEVGDVLYLLIWATKDSGLGEHWREQIGKRLEQWTNLKAGIWTLNGFSTSSRTDQAEYYSFTAKAEFDQFDKSPRIELAFDRPLNESISGTSVVFQTEDVESNLTLDGFGAAPGPSIALEYDYSGGASDYTIDITKKQSSTCGGGPYNDIPDDGDSSNDFPKTRSTTGSFTYTDESVTSGNHYCYHIEITDSAGKSVTANAEADAT